MSGARAPRSGGRKRRLDVASAAVLALAGCAPIAPYRGAAPAPGAIVAFAGAATAAGAHDTLRTTLVAGSTDHAAHRVGRLAAPADADRLSFLIYGDNRPGFRMEANSPAYEPVEHFSLTDGGRFLSGLLWSPVFLVTAFLPTLDGPRDLVTVFTKRPRGGGEAKVQAAMEREPAVDAVLSLGDIVFDGRRGQLWADYAKSSATLRTRTLLFAAPGNHERPYDASSLAAWNAVVMPTPAPGQLWYALDVPDCDARIVFLDSNVLTDVHDNYPDTREDSLANAQLEWLDRTLADSTRFSLVALHHPLFSTGHYAGDWGGADSTRPAARRRARLLEICLRRHVTAVMAGHEHLYQRLWVQAPDGTGFWHITSGGGGSPLYRIERDEQKRSLDGPHPLGLSVSTGSLMSASVYHYCRLELPRGTDAAAGGPRLDVMQVRSKDNVERIDQIDLGRGPAR